MRTSVFRAWVPMTAGALLLGGVSCAYADDAGIHDYFLTGITAGTTPATPSESASPAAAAPVKARATMRRHIAAKPPMTKVAHRDTSKEALKHMHAHMRDLKKEKAQSSS